MQFKIRRVSQFGDGEGSPCAGATRYVRTRKDIAGNPYLHYEWRISVSDIQELLDLVASTGKSIIVERQQPYEREDGMRSLLIYDDYIE
jgi:hypothetical protein